MCIRDRAVPANESLDAAAAVRCPLSFATIARDRTLTALSTGLGDRDGGFHNAMTGDALMAFINQDAAIRRQRSALTAVAGYPTILVTTWPMTQPTPALTPPISSTCRPARAPEGCCLPHSYPKA